MALSEKSIAALVKALVGDPDGRTYTIRGTNERGEPVEEIVDTRKGLFGVEHWRRSDRT